jgi:Do/DeqQ family serine protease
MRLASLATLVVAAVVSAGSAVGQTRVTPESRAQVQLSFAPIVKRTAPAVVNVYGARQEEQRQNRGMDEFLRRFFGDRGAGTPHERLQRSLGSGVVIDSSGLVVTNHHVIAGMTDVKVALADRREFEAEIVLRDPRTDLAVLRIKGQGPFTVMDFGDSEALEVGDVVLAMGNPFGVGQTVTQGIVSALARTQLGISDYQFFIQTDAAINPGNSGGALVDMNGQLVGINSAIYSQSGGSHGIGFAIPSSMVKAVVESAKGGSAYVRRPWLGAKLQSVTPEIAESMGLERPTGVLVAAVTPKSPAEQAGLKVGDLILAIDGRPIEDPDTFGYRFALKGLSGQTELTTQRGKQRGSATLKLMSAPETRPRDVLKVRARSPLVGATTMNLSPAVADELQIETGTDGVVVADVEEGSTANQIGLQKGDILVAVNGKEVATTKDLERMVQNPAQVWELTITRNGQTLRSVFRG